jgi:MOSC domain-containing protein YiiM
MAGVLKQISRSNGGVPKQAISGPVSVDASGVVGDRHNNPLVHGGPNKAVLLISAEFIEELAAKGYPVVYGSLGENLTISGLDPHSLRSGQRYSVGDEVIIELTKLRQPCLNLDVYGPSIKAELFDSQCESGDYRSPRWARGGFYARVLKPGFLIAGAPVVLLSDVA